jgi:chromosome partitioning protein
MIVIAVANQKGGTGKTTTAVNLSAALVHSGRSCLLVDLDAQATATRHMLGTYGEDGGVIYDVLLQGVPIRSCIHSTPAGIDVVASNLSLATLDIDLLQVYNREHRLRLALASIEETYDYVVVDCPPNLGFTTVNAFVACSVCVIPIECKAEAWEAVPRLMTALKRVATEFQSPLRLYALPTFLERTNLARDIYEQIREHFETQTLSPVHKNTRLAEAFAARQTILQYDPTASGAMDYVRVAKELIDDQETTVRRRVERHKN